MHSPDSISRKIPTQWGNVCVTRRPILPRRNVFKGDIVFQKYTSADQGLERRITVVNPFQESSLTVSVNVGAKYVHARTERTLHPISKHLAPTSSIRVRISKSLISCRPSSSTLISS